MAIPDPVRTNFDTLLRAADDGNLALMECLDAATRETRYVLCAVGRDGGDYVFTPFGHLASGNPYDAYLPPDPDDPAGFVEKAEDGGRIMMTVDEILADDRRNPPSERSLPWEETRNGVTVIVEPKPHWAEDMRAFRLDAREYCRYADWTAHGARTRFFGHIDTSGDDVMMKARAMIAREIADGFWD